jgi:hypothetical protein
MFLQAVQEMQTMKPPMFFVHTTGNSPYKIDMWCGPYRSVSTAKGQATRQTRDEWDGTARGDFEATIYRMVFNTETDPTYHGTYNLFEVDA